MFSFLLGFSRELKKLSIVELAALFFLTSITSTILFAFSRFFRESKLAIWIITPGILSLVSLWIGLFLDISEKENGEWLAVAITGLFLHGLSAFFLFLLQILRERFLQFPVLPLSVYTLEPVFLNVTCFISVIFNYAFLKFFDSAISIATLVSLFILFPFYTFFYYNKYKDLDYVPQSNFLKIYLLFSILFFLYFVVGVMCLFILSPNHIPELK